MLSNFILFFALLFLIFLLTFYIVSKILNNKQYTSENNEDSFHNENTPSTRWPFNRKLGFSMKKPPKTDTIRCCPYCDSKVPKGAWKCWHCKNRLPVKKSDIIACIVLGFVSLLFFVYALTSFVSVPSYPAPTISKSEYISQCKTISYEKLARNPDSYIGDYFTFTGEVIQVVEQGNYVNLRVNVTHEELYGTSFYNDTIFVVTTLSDNGDRILEGDIITLYGVCDGLYTYTTIFGASMSIPKIDAAYWDI